MADTYFNLETGTFKPIDYLELRKILLVRETGSNRRKRIKWRGQEGEYT